MKRLAYTLLAVVALSLVATSCAHGTCDAYGNKTKINTRK